MDNIIVKIRKEYNMTQYQFSIFTGIPFKTIQNWEYGRRRCPDWVLNLLEFYVREKKKNVGGDS